MPGLKGNDNRNNVLIGPYSSNNNGTLPNLNAPKNLNNTRHQIYGAE